MGFYEKYLLPRLLNLAMKSPELTRLRQAWLPRAEGKVLEVGIGSGLNLPFYEPGVHVTGVDPSLELQEMARDVAGRSGIPVEFVAQGCEDLPFGRDTFDTAVITWTLCTIPDPDSALAEVRRVLRPSGKLVFIEHGRAVDAGVARWQDRLNPIWGKIAGGCNLNRQPDDAIARQGFRFSELDQGYVPGPKFATYNYRGIATPA